MKKNEYEYECEIKKGSISETLNYQNFQFLRLTMVVTMWTLLS